MYKYIKTVTLLISTFSVGMNTEAFMGRILQGMARTRTTQGLAAMSLLLGTAGIAKVNTPQQPAIPSTLIPQSLQFEGRDMTVEFVDKYTNKEVTIHTALPQGDHIRYLQRGKELSAQGIVIRSSQGKYPPSDITDYTAPRALGKTWREWWNRTKMFEPAIRVNATKDPKTMTVRYIDTTVYLPSLQKNPQGHTATLEGLKQCTITSYTNGLQADCGRIIVTALKPIGKEPAFHKNFPVIVQGLDTNTQKFDSHKLQVPYLKEQR